MRPGPSGSGSSRQPPPSTTVASVSGGRRRATAASSDSAQAIAARRAGSLHPAAPRGGGEVARLGRGLEQQQLDQLGAAAAAHVLDLGLGLGVALDRVGGQLVDVGEAGLGEDRQRLGAEVGAAAGVGEAAPGDAGTDPVGGLERVERPALALLAASEGAVDVAAGLAPGLGVADQGDELREGLGDAGADAAPEAALERAGVLGDLAGDRGEDRRGDRSQLGLDQVGDRRRQGAPGLSVREVRRLFFIIQMTVFA